MDTKKPGLESSVETVSDHEDQDLISYVQEFARTFGDGIQMEKISLKTPEEAKESLAYLNALHNRIEAKQRQAQLLKQLLESKRV